jgi:hypothetical protein
MIAEVAMVLSDAGDRLADGAGHTGSGALGRRCGSSISTAQANGAGEFSKQEIAGNHAPSTEHAGCRGVTHRWS